MKLFGKDKEKDMSEQVQPEPGPEPVDEGLGNEIPVEPTVEVRVRKAGEGTVTMYRDGIPVEVPSDKVGHFQGLGFLLHAPVDLPGLTSEVVQIMGQIGPSLEEMVGRVTEDGVIDPAENAELHVLTRTVNIANQKLQQLLNVIYQSYPMKEADD